MNEFAIELQELIDKWRDHPGTTDEEIVGWLMDAIDDLTGEDDE